MGQFLLGVGGLSRLFYVDIFCSHEKNGKVWLILGLVYLIGQADLPVKTADKASPRRCCAAYFGRTDWTGNMDGRYDRSYFPLWTLFNRDWRRPRFIRLLCWCVFFHVPRPFHLLVQCRFLSLLSGAPKEESASASQVSPFVPPRSSPSPLPSSSSSSSSPCSWLVNEVKRRKGVDYAIHGEPFLTVVRPIPFWWRFFPLKLFLIIINFRPSLEDGRCGLKLTLNHVDVFFLSF